MSFDAAKFGEVMMMFLQQAVEQSAKTEQDSGQEESVPFRQVSRAPDTSGSVNPYSGGSRIEADMWLDRFESAKGLGRWDWEYTKAVLLKKLVGSAWMCQRAKGMLQQTYEAWRAAFVKAYL